MQAGSGGVWNFPLQLLATPADPDDTIILNSAGLHKENTSSIPTDEPSRVSI